MGKDDYTVENIWNAVDDIEEAWLECRELRLGQLISNAIADAEIETPLFYIEDAELIAAIRNYATKNADG